MVHHTSFPDAQWSVLQHLWDSSGPSTSDAELGSWLPAFFDNLLTAVTAELAWAASHIPEQYPEASLHLLSTFFGRISKSFRSRIETAISQGRALSALGLQCQ